MSRHCLLLLLPLAALAGCGEPIADDHFSNNSVDGGAGPAAADVTTTVAVPVRVGDYGLGLDACPWAGTTRRIEPGAGLPVRAAPSDTGAEAGSVPAGASFFVCARSLDQKWLGIVYDEGGALAARCGVASPVAARAYRGPCRSGWVSSAFVKMIAGDLPAPANRTDPEPVPGNGSAADVR
jgi:hypothetical protein